MATTVTLKLSLQDTNEIVELIEEKIVQLLGQYGETDPINAFTKAEIGTEITRFRALRDAVAKP